MSDLPLGWESENLGTLTSSTRPICYGVLKPGPFDSSGVPLLRIQDLAGNRVSTGSLHYITKDLAAKYSRSRLEGGEVLLSIQGTIGRVAIVPESLAGANISRTLAVIAPADVIDRRLLYFYLQLLASQQAFETGGSTRASLNIGTIRRMTVPLPPLAEQRRIVAAIEEHFSRLDAAEESLRRAQRRISGLRNAVYAELTSGSWELVKLRSVLREPLRNGHSAKATTDDSGIRTITLTAVTKGDFSDENSKVTTADPHRVSGLWLEPGDILIERSNTPELVGTAALFQGKRDWAIFPDLLIRVRTANELIPEFLESFLKSSKARRYFRDSAQGIAGSMPKIDQRTVEDLDVPLPPLPEQRRIVAEIERRLSLVDALAAATTAALQRAAALRRSILERALSGKLVPQDPTDEPASVLLERIRAERAASPTSKRRRSRPH